jgi:hypothetical protein
MKVLLLSIGILITYFSFSQDYSVQLIPDSLKLNANAVKRMEEIYVSIESTKKVMVRRKYAITVFNKRGAAFAAYYNSYSSLKKLNSIEGSLYDAAGKKIGTVKRKEIEDAPYSDGFSLMQDNRIKSHQFYQSQFPYTVEYEEEEENLESYFLPFWMPVEGYFMSVQNSKFTVEAHAGYQLRIKQMNHDVAPLITNTGNKIYTWQISNYASKTPESYQTAIKDILPIVYIGPNEFYIGGYEGQMDSWKNLGKFHTSLNAGRDILPEKIKSEIHQITDPISDEKEKIKAAYTYLQKNTRYISIQLGIGGWQTFDANYVAEKKYGDCKALSNYMVSLLKEIGIKAYYVLITAGEGRKGLVEDFPAPYFNHVICCVPGKTDTTWLECTSQTEAPGYLGSFTGNRKALLIGDDGGSVVNTPLYQSGDNRQIRTVAGHLDLYGNLTAEVKTNFTGLQQEEARNLMYSSTQEEKENYLNNTLSIPTYKIEKFQYKEIKSSMPEIEEQLTINAPGYANLSGKRIFLVPNLFNRSGTRLPDNSSRKNPIYFNNAFLDIDTITIHIPDGYLIETAPKNTTLNSPFGNYSVAFEFTEKYIRMIRYRKSEINVFPATDYPKLVEFMNQIYKADHSRIVLVKKETI